jgi:UDP:flavonoid glycosyltransferase YjiC (YdhE family)
MADKLVNYDEIAKVEYGSAQHAMSLEIGYQMSVAEAEEIIKEGAKDKPRVSLDDVKKAKAMLAALHTVPVVVARRDMWHSPSRG